jgi:hypothetical protein
MSVIWNNKVPAHMPFNYDIHKHAVGINGLFPIIEMRILKLDAHYFKMET